jgi:F0F1-type ATP synthase assembly protein I
MPFNNPIPEDPSRRRGARGFDALIKAETAMQIALVLPSAVVVGWLLGTWADKSFHQTWFSIAGIVLGCVSGLAYVIRVALAMMNESDSVHGERRGGKGDGQPQS